MFDINLEKVIKSVMKDAKRVRKNKNKFASITDHSENQLYYVLTEDQMELLLEELRKTKESEKKGQSSFQKEINRLNKFAADYQKANDSKKILTEKYEKLIAYLLKEKKLTKTELKRFITKK